MTKTITRAIQGTSFLAAAVAAWLLAATWSCGPLVAVEVDTRIQSEGHKATTDSSGVSPRLAFPGSRVHSPGDGPPDSTRAP